MFPTLKKCSLWTGHYQALPTTEVSQVFTPNSPHQALLHLPEHSQTVNLALTPISHPPWLCPFLTHWQHGTHASHRWYPRFQIQLPAHSAICRSSPFWTHRCTYTIYKVPEWDLLAPVLEAAPASFLPGLNTSSLTQKDVVTSVPPHALWRCLAAGWVVCQAGDSVLVWTSQGRSRAFAHLPKSLQKVSPGETQQVDSGSLVFIAQSRKVQINMNL